MTAKLTRFWHLLVMAVGGARRTPLRLTLTALGVSIATGALVSMVAFALGVQARAEEPFRKFEFLNRITVTPSATRVTEADPPDSRGGGAAAGAKPNSPPERLVVLDDATFSGIRAIPGVTLACPEVSLPIHLLRGDRRVLATASPVPSEAGAFAFVREALVSGRFFAAGNRGQIILGTGVLESLGFENAEHAVGEPLILRMIGPVAKIVDGKPEFQQETLEREVEVVGVWRLSGWGPWSRRELVLLPSELFAELPGAFFEATMEQVRAGDLRTTKGYLRGVVRVKRPSDVAVVEKEIEKLGLEARSFLGRLEEMQVAFVVIDIVLAAVGTVALVVAGLGIINTLLMAVLERYREIGICKALGASDADIRILFIVEAALVGLAGGAGGLLLGRVVSWIIQIGVNGFAASRGVPHDLVVFSFPFWLLAGAVLFAVTVSVVSGLYPASRAARVDPIQALRSG